MLEQLQDLGFTKREAKIYNTIFSTQKISASEVTKKITGNRTATYNTLQALINKGVINCITENGKRLYSITDPENFLSNIKQKEIIAQEIITKIKATKTEHKIPDSMVEIYDGVQGLKNINRELIKSKEIRMLNVTGLIREPLKYSQGWLKEILKVNSIKIIANKNMNMPEFHNKKNVSIKYLPSKNTNYATMFIFDNKVVIQKLKGNILVVKIKDPDIYAGFKDTFELLWENLK